MDFGWTEEQLKRRAEVVEFAQRELGDDDLVGRDREGVFSRDNWNKCAQFGVLGLSVPEEYGGAEVDLLTAMLLMEGLGYGCADNGLTFALNAQLWTVQLPIVRFGTEEVAAKARRASDTEYEAMWAKLQSSYPFYDNYRKRTSRPIAVVVLERV